MLEKIRKDNQQCTIQRYGQVNIGKKTEKKIKRNTEN